jgi:hypothetical protein
MRCYARPVPPDNHDATGGLWRNMADDVGTAAENYKGGIHVDTALNEVQMSS